MKLTIKNMIDQHSLILVKDELTKLGLNYQSVELGSAEIIGDISAQQVRKLSDALAGSGLELQECQKRILVKKIKEVINAYVYGGIGQVMINFSDHLSLTLGYDYTYLANVFSKVEGSTIEKYIISNKIERAKKMIEDCHMKLTDIAVILHYSSVAHFSNQFKNIAGVTPSTFKKQRCNEAVIDIR